MDDESIGTVDQSSDEPLDGATVGEVETEESAEFGDEQADTTQDDLPGISDDDPRLVKKLKDLEAGYTKKYQALADERRAFDEAKAAQQGQQPQSDHWAKNIEWDYEDDTTKTLASQIYRQEQMMEQMQALLLGRVMPTVEETTIEKQMMGLQSEYGEAFDRDALMAARIANPGVPLEFVAAKVFQDKIKEQAANKTYQNVQAKRKATSPPSSNATVKDDVDTSNWGLHDFFEHAKRTGRKF